MKVELTHDELTEIIISLYDTEAIQKKKGLLLSATETAKLRDKLDVLQTKNQ